MKHVPEASDIPSFAEAVGADAGEVRHQLDVVAQASGFTEEEANDLDAFVAEEGWGGDEDHDGDAEGDGREEEGCSDREASDCEEEAKGDDDQEEEEEDQRDGEREASKGRVRRVKAPESVTKRVHDAVQRQRRAAGAGRGGKASRNHQKRKEKGKMLYKHRDF